MLIKGLDHFLRTLKVLNIEKGLHHIFTTLKSSQNGYTVECSWTATSEGRLSHHIYDYWTTPALNAQFHSIGNNFLSRTKFSWNEENYTCLNVKCVLLCRNFDFLGRYLVVTVHYLMVITDYYSLRLVTARSYFSMNGLKRVEKRELLERYDKVSK